MSAARIADLARTRLEPVTGMTAPTQDLLFGFDYVVL